MEGKENLREKTISCAYCYGKGRERGSSMVCIVCKGRGVNAISGIYDNCSSCGGKGRKNVAIALYCLDCRGRGVVSQNKTTQMTQEINKNLGFRKKEGGTKVETSWLRRFIKNIIVQEN